MSTRNLPTITVANEAVDGADAVAIDRIAATALPGFLPAQRWFGDKARSISRIGVEHLGWLPSISPPIALVVVSVDFSRGEPASYFVPIALAAGDEAERPIATVAFADRELTAFDAVDSPPFRAWVAETIAGGATMTLPTGQRVAGDPASEETAGRLRRVAGHSRRLAAEQSNSALLYGDEVLVKIFRRLQVGTNPDVELSRFLSLRTPFDSLPDFVGTLTLDPFGGETATLAVAQAFVQSEGDGWEHVLDRVRTGVSAPNPGDWLQRSGTEIGADLGRVSAHMHLALGSDPWTPQLTPEPVTRDDLATWAAHYDEGVRGALDALDDARPHLVGRSRDLVEALEPSLPRLRQVPVGFERLLGRSKTRVHGDYHLGQTLRGGPDGFVVLDFEGEPLRSIAERRQKTSPLKDVAGMLRSFGYARGTAEAWLDEPGATATSADLVTWERSARDAFLQTYLETCATGAATHLPATPDEIREAVAAWELDKAVYELNYELNNRPDWVWIPLAALLKLAAPIG